MRTLKFILILFSIFFYLNSFAQKAKTYKGVYNKENVLFVITENSDQSYEGYFYNPKTPNKKKGITFTIYDTFLDVTLFNKYKNGTFEDIIADGKITNTNGKNWSGYLEIDDDRKIYLQINNFKNK